jgi:hypothetical protein
VVLNVVELDEEAASVAMGVTLWVWGGCPWVLGTLIDEGVKFEVGGKIGLKQSLMYMHPLSLLVTHFF